MLALFVARGGEEGNVDEVVRVLFFECFNYRQALFKLTQGGSVKPSHRSGIAGKGRSHLLRQVFSTLHKQCCLAIKWGDHFDEQAIEGNEYVIQD